MTADTPTSADNALSPNPTTVAAATAAVLDEPVLIPAQAGRNAGLVQPPALMGQGLAQQPVHVSVQVAAPLAPQVVIQVKQRGLFVRALYYVFVGWWLSGLMMFAAGMCIASVALLPAGLAMVNRLPQVMTLRPRSTALTAAVLADGSMQYTVGSAAQRGLLVRTIYFCLVGWWAGMFVMFAAWVLSVLIVTMPLGLMLLNRVPAVITLRRN